MRNAIIETLYTEALRDPNIYFITGDFQHVREKEFRGLGERYQNGGMAEQNIIGVAAGLALSGKKVFVYSIIPFITLRCIEQVKVDVCSHKADVTIIGGGAGFAYGTCGATHLAIEDIAMMRSLPHMKIVSPSGPTEATALMRKIIQLGGPAYIRLGKKGEDDLTDKTPEFGKGMVVREGKDVCIIATGTILAEALKASEIVQRNGISVEVVNIHTIKPLDEDLVRDRALFRRLICTVEEHSVIGGLGGAVAEVLAEAGGTARFKRFGISDDWPSVVGTQQYLRGVVGLSGDKIAIAVGKLL
ncbi:MAG: transketolase C-terminal domain-containing protein [Candidatus Jorgensenbacteria bacterium]